MLYDGCYVRTAFFYETRDVESVRKESPGTSLSGSREAPEPRRIRCLASQASPSRVYEIMVNMKSFFNHLLTDSIGDEKSTSVLFMLLVISVRGWRAAPIVSLDIQSTQLFSPAGSAILITARPLPYIKDNTTHRDICVPTHIATIIGKSTSSFLW
jgi:hypothetical protein